MRAVSRTEAFAMAVTEQDVQQSLRQLVDPNLERDFISAKSVKSVRVDDGNVTVDIQLAYPARSQHEAIRRRARSASPA